MGLRVKTLQPRVMASHSPRTKANEIRARTPPRSGGAANDHIPELCAKLIPAGSMQMSRA